MFRAGLQAAAAGRHDIAAMKYRHLLREVPAPRIKLELARSLLHSGEYREALDLFRAVYAAPSTPQAVKRNILPFMEEAELRIVRVRYGVRGITDTNPSRVADGGTIFFNGIPLEYQPPAPREVSFGVEPWLTVEKLWQNGLLTKFHGAVRYFDDRNLDAIRTNVSVGKRVGAIPGLFVQANVTSDINNGSSYVLPTIEAWKRFRLSDRAAVGVGGQIGYMFAENQDISGTFYRPYVFGDWTFLPNATAFGRLSMEHLNSRNEYYSYASPKLDFGVDVNISGLNLLPQISLSQTSFTQFDPFWGVDREDITVRSSLSVSHDRFEWRGFQPELTVFYEERNSNVDIYDYDQIGGHVSLKKVY